jgi:hypothetical protein
MKDLYDLILEHGSSPPVDIELIIMGLGLELDSDAFLPPGVSGQIELLPTGTYKISANGEEHFKRRRFTMAHELGHYIHHRDLIGAGISDSKAYRSTETDKFYNTKIKATHETQANRFAAAILMPYDIIRRQHSEGKTPQQLADEWQVSLQAMNIRLGLS